MQALVYKYNTLTVREKTVIGYFCNSSIYLDVNLHVTELTNNINMSHDLISGRRQVKGLDGKVYTYFSQFIH